MLHITKVVPSPLPESPPVPGVRTRFLDANADYDSLAELIRACHAHDGIPWLPNGATLRSEMSVEDIDPARDVVLVESDGRLIAATGVERALRDGAPVYVLWGQVAPDRRRRGIGGWLLDWTIRRASQRAATEDPDGIVQLGAHVDEEAIGARTLYERAGFGPVRHFFLMRSNGLDEVPDIPLPVGLEVRPVQPDQHRTIFDAENEAFRDHWGHHEQGEDVFRETFGQAETNTDLWVVAWDGDQVAGVVQNWIWFDENERLGVRRGWLEHVSVRRPWRRRGLGRALTAAALVRLREAGMDEAMLGVDSENPSGALGLYEGLGFAVARRSSAYRRPLVR